MAGTSVDNGFKVLHPLDHVKKRARHTLKILRCVHAKFLSMFVRVSTLCMKVL